jgi:hypothetical protein
LSISWQLNNANAPLLLSVSGIDPGLLQSKSMVVEVALI